MRESSLERKLTSHVKMLGGLCIKFVSDSMAGLPDRIIFWPDGTITMVELKTPKGVVSEVQKAVHKLMAQYGHEVKIVRTKEEIERL